MAQAQRSANRATSALVPVLFASGASSLVLENLWFREIGVFLGNSVWATSLVLAAFMAGLALGSGLAARLADRRGRLIRLYGALELVVAVSGFAVVVTLPSLAAACAPVFRALADAPVALAAVRLGAAFVLLLVPTTAMGATLPVLVAALCRRHASFGRVLGTLYGWNTLGAVAGVLATELALVPWLGIRGSACVALVLSGTAGVLGLVLSRVAGETAEPPPAPVPCAAPASPWSPRRILACAFLCGAALLALEVIWFRFLALYVLGTTLAVSLMLAVILAGLGVGGLAASKLLQRAELRAEQLVPWLAVLAGVATLGAYALFPVDGFPGSPRWQDAVADALRLALPTSIASGALFAILGAAAKRQLGRASHAAGTLVVWNTLGAMVGALAAGFVLLPNAGVDGSLFVVCALYGVVALIMPRTTEPSRTRTGTLAEFVALGALAIGLALFPLGKMRRHVDALLSNVTSDDASIVAYREGLTATVSVIEHRWADRALSYQLVTDGFTMSSTVYNARRYMKLFVVLPVALRPDPQRALLICYGVGQTAKALVDTASLAHIDVVDISRDVLELGRVEFPPPAALPLDDPRVDVHTEDGRFFLQTTPQRYDLITGEPPPPQVAGVVNLYTREYFELVHAHLTDGGLTSYWLPVHELSVADAQAITHAFCDVFADCSLWTGFGSEWMLVGSRGYAGGASDAAIGAQWRDPRVAPELAAIGVEHVEQLGALFLADAATLHAWSDATPPLDDDHPARLGAAAPDDDRDAIYARWLDPEAARARFEASAWIARMFPTALRARTLPYFAVQRLIDDLPFTAPLATMTPEQLLATLHAIEWIQTTTDLRTLVLWMLGETAANEAIVDALGPTSLDPDVQLAGAIRALADRRYDGAAARFAAITPQTPMLRELAAYANAMAAHGL